MGASDKKPRRRIDSKRSEEIIRDTRDGGADLPEHIRSYRHSVRGGSRRTIETLEDLERMIDEYFAWADYKDYPYTVADLCLYLGLWTTSGLITYEGYSDAHYAAIKMAKLVIEAQRTRELLRLKTTPVGHIFELKNNFGWRDTVDVRHENEGFLSPDDMRHKLEVLLGMAHQIGAIQVPQQLPAGKTIEVEMVPSLGP